MVHSDFLASLLLVVADYIEASEVITAAPQDVLKRLKLADIQQVNRLVQTLCQDVAPKAKRLSDVADEDDRNWITTGDPEVDRLLGGGVRTGVITEVCGER
jgi:DNA repair protein RAD57